MRHLAVFALFAGAVVAVAAVGAPVAAAPVPKHLKPAAPTGDRAKLQGKWKLHSVEIGGKKVDVGATEIDMMIEFRGDTLIATSTITGQNQTTTATVKHDPAAGVKRFTTVNTRTVNNAGKNANPKDEKDEVFVYAFDGDKLFLGVSVGGGKAPIDPRKPGPNEPVLVLTRVK